MKPRVSQLDIAGTPDGTKFLRDDATWAVASAAADPRIVFEDTCDTSTVPGTVTSSGQLVWNGTDFQRELGGTSASDYTTPSFTLVGSLLLEVDVVHLAGLTAGAFDVAIQKAGVTAARISLQSDGNNVHYGPSTAYAATGTYTHVVGDGMHMALAISSNLRCASFAGPIHGSRVSGTQNGGYERISGAQFPSGLAGLAAGDTLTVKLSTSSTRKQGIYRVRLSRGGRP